MRRQRACLKPICPQWCGPGLDAIFLPKGETVEEVKACAALLDQFEAAKGMQHGAVEICLMIESALGVHNCYDLIKASPRVTATCIGQLADH